MKKTWRENNIYAQRSKHKSKTRQIGHKTIEQWGINIIWIHSLANRIWIYIQQTKFKFISNKQKQTKFGFISNKQRQAKFEFISNKLCEEGTIGIALNLESNNVGVVLMGDGLMIQDGSSVKATWRIAQIPVSEAYLGRVINALVKPIDGKGEISTSESRLIESPLQVLFRDVPYMSLFKQGLLLLIRWSL